MLMVSTDAPPAPPPDTRIPVRAVRAEDALPRESTPPNLGEPPLDTIDAQRKRFNDFMKLHGKTADATTEEVEEEEEHLEGEDGDEGEPAKGKATVDEDANGEAEEDEADPKNTVKANALERAITALRRAQVPQSVLKKMTQGEILAMAESHQSRQAERDNLKREFEEFKNAKEFSQSTKEPASRGEPAASPFNIDELVAPFTDHFDENTSKAMREYSTRMTKALNDHVGKLTAQHAQQLSFLGDVLSDVLFEGARQRLLESFPQLKSDKSATKARAKMQTLLATGDYKGLSVTAGINASAEDAMRILFPKSAAPVVSKSMRNGSPTTRSSASKQEGGSTIAKQKRAFDLVRSGGYTPSQARAAVGLD